MTRIKPQTVILLARAPLKGGVAAAITQFVYRNGWDILSHDQWVDHQKEYYFVRIEWSLSEPGIEPGQIRQAFAADVAVPFEISWKIWFGSDPVRIAVFVTSEMAHLYELLMHCISGLWNAEITLVVSNHRHLEKETARFEIPFHHIPIDADNKEAQEVRQLALLQEANVDLVVLSRYMQIVTGKLIAPYRDRIINIHHSMLPAFAGAKPYKQAYDRGVKLIGATSHYVTEELDAGPIIAQDVTPVSHRKSVAELIEIGRQLETRVLSRAVGLHVNRRVMVEDSRTILFD